MSKPTADRILELWNWTGPRACLHDEHNVPMVRLEDAAEVATAYLSELSRRERMEGALRPLVEAWTAYQEKSSSRHSEGQADAYYMLAKYLYGKWEAARAALTGDKT